MPAVFAALGENQGLLGSDSSSEYGDGCVVRISAAVLTTHGRFAGIPHRFSCDRLVDAFCERIQLDVRKSHRKVSTNARSAKVQLEQSRAAAPEMLDTLHCEPRLVRGGLHGRLGL